MLGSGFVSTSHVFDEAIDSIDQLLASLILHLDVVPTKELDCRLELLERILRSDDDVLLVRSIFPEGHGKSCLSIERDSILALVLDQLGLLHQYRSMSSQPLNERNTTDIILGHCLKEPLSIAQVPMLLKMQDGKLGTIQGRRHAALSRLNKSDQACIERDILSHVCIPFQRKASTGLVFREGNRMDHQPC